MTQGTAEAIFRPAALDAYRSGRMRPLDVVAYRPPRWPLFAVLALAAVAVAFAAVFRVPEFVRAVPLAVTSKGVVSMATAEGRTPGAGQPATLRGPDGREVRLRVTEVVTVTSRSAAGRLRIPTGIPLPATVILLAAAGPVDRSVPGGTVDIRTANPSLLSMLAAEAGWGS